MATSTATTAGARAHARIPNTLSASPRITHRTRRRIERAVETLLAILDGADGDTDLEPVLGSTVAEDAVGWPIDSAEREIDDDFESADDNGIADLGGLLEQVFGEAV